MTRTAVAFRHVMFEDLGILAPLLADHDYAVRYLDAGIDELDTEASAEADLLVVLGGPIGANDESRYPFLTRELHAITCRAQAGRPTLGICLGAQLVARALGAAVQPASRPEIGYAALDLTTEGLRTPLRHLEGVPVLHWHGDRFDLPAGATRLASTRLCGTQAFSAGPGVLALQFHLETGHRDLERWLIGHAESLAALELDPEAIRRTAKGVGPVLHAAAVQVFDDWLQACSAERATSR